MQTLPSSDLTMKRRLLALAAGVLLAGCASAAQLSDAPAPRGPAPAALNPVAMLIQARDSLGLNDLQVQAMQRIADELQRKNQPLLEQMRPAGGQGGGARGGRPRGGRGGGMGGGGMGGRPGGGRGRPAPAGADSLRARLEANRAEAMAQVDALLTEEQRAAAAAYLERHRPPRRGPALAPWDTAAPR